ncbi:MAG: FHA domain-containing protein [Deltaproteobacteria bacterium]|nr:FHA domain-containing protein [Deltaproteobacteria bacterium]
MDASVVRKTLELNPKLLRLLKDISNQTGLDLDSLVNLSLYELLRRLGYLAPQAKNIRPPEGADLLDDVEPAPPPIRRSGQASQAKNRGARARPAAKAKQDILYFQIDEEEYTPIRKKVFLLGRGSKCDFVLRHRGVSREHAVITRERGGWFIEDLNSANGVWLNGEQIGKHKLTGGDEINISNHVLRFTIRPG